MTISLQWLKDMDTPEYCAVQLIQKHKNKIIKFANLHVPKMWESVNDCCPPLVVLPLTPWMYATYIREKKALTRSLTISEYTITCLLLVTPAMMLHAAIYSSHALNKAQNVIVDFQCKLIDDPT